MTIKSQSLKTKFPLVLTAAVCAITTFAADYHLDAENGNDAADGLTQATAWKTIGRMEKAALAGGHKVLFRRGCVFRGNFTLRSGERGGDPLVYGAYGDGKMPLLLGSIAHDLETDWKQADESLHGKNVWITEKRSDESEWRDIGNIIFDDKKVGWKKWSVQELKADYDYYCDEERQLVYLRLSDNPARLHKSIELARDTTIARIDSNHDTVVRDLHFKNAGAFAIAGWGASYMQVKNCRMEMIGGAHQYTTEGGIPVRFGNGIEFWGGANHVVVEGCDICNVYDAAVTPQASDDLGTTFSDIVFRDNLIRKAEYSYEFWHAGKNGRTLDIVFEHNTCLDAGGGWAHAQRPDPSGSHLQFSRHRAETSGVVLRNNVFCGVTSHCYRMFRDRRDGVMIDYNLIYLDKGILSELEVVLPEDRETGVEPWFFRAGMDEFRAYQQHTGFDLHSAYGKPTFIDPEKGDWRLKSGTVGASLSSDGSAVGVRMVIADSSYDCMTGNEWVYDIGGWIPETTDSKMGDFSGAFDFDSSVSAGGTSDGTAGMDSIVSDFGVSNETGLISEHPSGLRMVIR